MHEALTLARKRTSALYVSFQKVFLLLSLFELVLLWRVALKGCFRGLHDFKFLKAVLVCGKDYDRIDVAFDRYRETSIKCATRKKRSREHASIRRVIEDGTVPLPRSWSNFLALDENKADLARFLSEKLLAGAPVSKIIIVSGGFHDEDTVKCSRPNIDVRALRGFHDEADTRIILHCIHSDAEFLVVACQETDVFCLLIAHIEKMRCKQLWMKAGTSKKPKYLPIHNS